MRKLLTTLLAAICLASTSARAAPFTVQDLLVNGSITFAAPLSGTALGSVCVNGSNQVIIGSTNCFPSGTGTITGPGSSTVGYVPLWSNVGGTQVGAGLPVTQTGAASSLVETGASGAIAFSSDGVASIVGNGADGLMLNVGAGQAVSLVSTGNTGTIGKLSFLAQDSTGTTVDYGDLSASVVSNTHGATVGALDMPVLATGSTTPRNLSEWESDLTNVKAFGAKLDGTTNDSASLTSARAQITTNGRVLIPNGNILASDTVTIPSGSEAIWDMNAQPTTGWNSYLPGFGTDIIHTENGGEWWYQRATSATAGQGTAPIIRLDRQMTHTGGGGWAMMQLNDVIAATANPGGQTTSLNVNTTSNETASGESPMVGIYQNMIRNSGSATPGYGMNISVKDLTGAAQNIATIGVESDLIANGTWSNYQAGNFDLVLKKGLSASPIFEANFGVRVGNWEADLTQGGYQEPYWIGATNVYQCGFCGIATLAAGVPFFDASQATYTDANGIAVRLGSGNAIDFAGDGSHKLYLAAGPELAYSKSGSLLLGVEDAGKLDAAGIVNAFANGTPILETTSAANTGTVGKLSFLAQDSTGATVDYGDLTGSVVSNTHGATRGQIQANTEMQITATLPGTTQDEGLNIVTTPIGSGVNGPATAQFGLNITHEKQNWATTSQVGEIDGANIMVRQGGPGSDAGGLLMNIQGTGQGFVAQTEMVSSIYDTGTSAITYEVDTQLGALSKSTSKYYGFVATAKVGDLSNGILIQDQGGTTSWDNAFTNVRNGVTNFNVSGAGTVTANVLSLYGNSFSTGADPVNGAIQLGVPGGGTGMPYVDFYGDSVSGTYAIRMIADQAGRLALHTAAGSSDGTLYVFSGKVIAGNTETQLLQGIGGNPTITACGTSFSLDAGATNLAGTITEGTSATGCVITFATTPKPFTAAPHCVISSPNGAPFTSYSTSTTALTIVNASASGNEYTYICAQ